MLARGAFCCQTHNENLSNSTSLTVVNKMMAGILLECKESDVGVLVSGPKSMRHEVAKICASGSAKNLLLSPSVSVGEDDSAWWFEYQVEYVNLQCVYIITNTIGISTGVIIYVCMCDICIVKFQVG